jgi:hypothetical protein
MHVSLMLYLYYHSTLCLFAYLSCGFRASVTMFLFEQVELRLRTRVILSGR